MQIEITEKEKTALSILLGLRQKFSREKKDNESYSASELHRLFSELIGQINRGELRFLDTLHAIHTPEKPRDEVWGEIDEAIERSKIRRFDWDNVFGKSLTQEILLLKKQGLDVKETFKTLCKDQRVTKFVEENKRSQRKILENLKISVHARFGENNTAQRIMQEKKQ